MTHVKLCGQSLYFDLEIIEKKGENTMTCGLPELNINNIAGVIWAECGRLNHSPPAIHSSISREYSSSANYHNNQLYQKYAMALIVLNRHQQRIVWGAPPRYRLGRGTMQPCVPSGPLDPITSQQWEECLDAARNAISLVSAPIRSRSRYWGVQYYQHSWNPNAPSVWTTREGTIPDAHLVQNIGPAWDNRPNKGEIWLRIYFNGNTLTNALRGPGVPHTVYHQNAIYR